MCRHLFPLRYAQCFHRYPWLRMYQACLTGRGAQERAAGVVQEAEMEAARDVAEVRVRLTKGYVYVYIHTVYKYPFESPLPCGVPVGAHRVHVCGVIYREVSAGWLPQGKILVQSAIAEAKQEAAAELSLARRGMLDELAEQRQQQAEQAKEAMQV
jgi:hypothetical protein